MTEDQKYEIAVLAEDYERKRQTFEYHQMRNVWGKTSEEMLQMSIAYNIAESEMLEAKGHLDRAKRRAYERR